LEPPEDTRPPHRPRSPWRVLLLAAGMLVFLGLVAAVSRAHDTPGGRAGVHSPPSGVGDYLFTIFLIIVAAMMLFMVWLWFSERDILAQQRKRQSTSTRLLIFFGVFALIMVVAGRPLANALRDLGVGKDTSDRATVNGGKAAKALEKEQRQKAAAAGPEFKWLPVFIATAAGLAVLGFIGVRTLRRERRGLAETHALQLEFEELVEDTLADLYAEVDPRKAIIAAYARVERVFASYGLPREPSEAPVEYLDRALPELRASGAALQRLTSLFQWAKFSAHDVDPKMRDEAIGALLEVRDELRANRVEEEIRQANKPLIIRGDDPYERARGRRS
jgi:Domain of unknown function (DUF4129)